MFDIAGLHIPGRQTHSRFTDMKYAIYPQWLENIFKFTDLKCVNFINLSTMVLEIILEFTDLKCVNIINLSTMVGENFGIY